MAGNIRFGGGIGGIIDHNKGTAYDCPEWVRLEVDKEGAPNLRAELLIATSQK